MRTTMFAASLAVLATYTLSAIAVIDIRNARVKKIFALGFKDHSRPRNTLDPSDGDGDFDKLFANLLPDDFNSNHEENDSFDNLSDNKGPEPGGVTVGKVKGKLYAFVGLERIGGNEVSGTTTVYEFR